MIIYIPINASKFLVANDCGFSTSCQQVEEFYGLPRQHNLYGSGDMSSQLVDDFGQPICRMMTRS